MFKLSPLKFVKDLFVREISDYNKSVLYLDGSLFAEFTLAKSALMFDEVSTSSRSERTLFIE